MQTNKPSESMRCFGRITEVSNETGMDHGYASGLQYYMVESGGNLRKGLGFPMTNGSMRQPWREQT